MGLRAKCGGVGGTTNSTKASAATANGKITKITNHRTNNVINNGNGCNTNSSNTVKTKKSTTTTKTPMATATKTKTKTTVLTSAIAVIPKESAAAAAAAGAAVALASSPASSNGGDTEDETTTTTCTISRTKTTTTTYRSNSTSALVAAAAAQVYMRPQTLNVHNPHETPTDRSQLFFGEVLNAWRAKARCNVVPAERTQELFHELSFHPNEKQICEMLQTAKMLARKGSRQANGLTFGEFCVLAADLKRFRTSTFPSSICDKVTLLSSLQNEATNDAEMSGDINGTTISSGTTTTATAPTTTAAPQGGTELRSTKSLSNVEDCKKQKKRNLTKSLAPPDGSSPVEVFLGGSCNPTTWRADVAIPALKESGISFYNPQVSDWTPDLIELEHRAKEKARVLFFVMDSETRATAGAIEAAHIAGQNSKQLVLVLHPYKQNQHILNEPISQQEYVDLARNQQILKELVTRRGLPVLDNIPLGLQRTKEILAGFRDPPSNIASILVVVRGAFDRVNPSDELITVEQCQRALTYLGYAQSLLNLENLNRIIASQRDALDSMLKRSSTKSKLHAQNQEPSPAVSSSPSSTSSLSTSTASSPSSSSSSSSSNITITTSTTKKAAQPGQQPSTSDIDFDLFCVITAYLSVLQQEIHESGCISPIKGTNVPPPPVYLTNMQGDEGFAAISYFASSKNISRTSSNTSVPSNDERQNLNELLCRSRDSGTSSPQPPTLLEPLKSRSAALIAAHQLHQQHQQQQQQQQQQSQQPQQQQAHPHLAHLPTTLSNETASTTTEEESDSNDSVFSSSSSINSMNYQNCCNSTADVFSSCTNCSSLDFRDVYLGGSCFLRSKWRQDVAMPYLKSKGVTFHLPALHESIHPSQVDLPEKVVEEARAASAVERSSSSGFSSLSSSSSSSLSFMRRTRRKCRAAQLAQEAKKSATGAADADTADDQQARNGTAQPQEEEDELTISASSSYSWIPLKAPLVRKNLYNPSLLDSSRVLLFVITNETRSLAPMTLAAHCIGLMYNVVLTVQMLPEDCVIGNEKLTPAAIKDYNRGRAYLIDLAKRQGVPVFNDLKAALECTVDKVKSFNTRYRYEC